MCRRLSRSIDNCREWRQRSGLRLSFSHRVAQERYRCWATDGKSAVERLGSSPASSFFLSPSGVIRDIRNSRVKRCHRTSFRPAYVSSEANFLATATETARTLAAKSAAAVQVTKRLMKRALREQLEQAVKLENALFAEQVRSDDAQQAFQAFFAKRQPVTMQ